jgi:membrane-bound lytic murein transglycosylase B
MCSDPEREDVRAFIERVHSNSGLDPATRCSILGLARIQPPIIEAISRPAERVRPWHEYRKIFMTRSASPPASSSGPPSRTHRANRRGDRRAAGDPRRHHRRGNLLRAHHRRYRVLDALATLAFEYPPRSTPSSHASWRSS